MYAKKAIVTGANGKIGRSFVRSLVAKGYFVYSVDINGEGLKSSENVEAVQLDITGEQAVHDSQRIVYE